MSFWHNLPKPIMVLAPLANVTDASFRRVIAKHSAHVRKDGTVGGPDVMWTEFVSADGLVKADEDGKKKLMADLMYTEGERPIVAQLFTSNPEHMEIASRLCLELGFDGIDINMGCPDRTVEKQGAGAALIKKPDLAIEVLRAAMRGASNEEKTIPVSVKTRIGYNKNELDTWIPRLLKERPAVITLHARTRKELSLVPARWEHVREAVVLRDEIQKDLDKNERTLIIGNGDAESLEDAEKKVLETGADGVMFGRAIFGNPWFFNPRKVLCGQIALSEQSSPTHQTPSYGSLDDSVLPRSSSHTTRSTDSSKIANEIETVTLEERLKVMVEHTKLFEELLPFKSFALMKKHYKAYVNGFNGAKELRMELMEKETSAEVEEVVYSWLKNHEELI